MKIYYELIGNRVVRIARCLKCDECIILPKADSGGGVGRICLVCKKGKA
jgi:hypothetical protein